jgi:hypothetical protein
MNEDDLVRKLASIEALFAGASTPGERVAADQARSRILERLREFEGQDRPQEYRFTLSDSWSRRLFVALLRRYGIRPYRYKRQRHTTVMAAVSESFVDQVLWPEFVELDNALKSHLNEVTERVVSLAIGESAEEAEVVSTPALSAAGEVQG